MELHFYTPELLEHHLLPELKQIAQELGITPDGNKTRRETWINALVGQPFPIFQTIEVQALEPIETSPAVEIIQALEPIETPPGVEIIQALEPIEKSLDVEIIQALEPIAPSDIQHQASIEKSLDVDRIDAPAEFPDMESALAEIKRLRTANEELLSRVRSQSTTIARARDISPVAKPSLKRVRDMASQAFLDVVKDVHYGFNLTWGAAKKHFRHLKEIWELLILDDWPLSDWFNPQAEQQAEVPLPIFPPKRSRFGAVPFCDDNLIDSYSLGFAGVESSGRSPPWGGDAML
ncbi:MULTISPECIES: hypothetical protein [unclassified Microcoleus]|uniref:hypothetical protein n=1 Tax=unclassified Microcoleus TaxID=2642155 RepID=UPI002FD00BB2